VVLRITAVPDDPTLLDLPWDVPLEQWPAESLVPLPRGISRHVVRFVRLSGRVYAVKEVGQHLAEREFSLLRALERLDVPSVEAVGVVSGRETASGAALDPALITRHLQFSLPYRALFSRTLRPDTARRLLDALAVLLVRLHLAGFYWGDCSLSNTLFRRDAGAFAAYLVDAETGELHPGAVRRAARARHHQRRHEHRRRAARPRGRRAAAPVDRSRSRRRRRWSPATASSGTSCAPRLWSVRASAISSTSAYAGSTSSASTSPS
jgi:hypothetical protein